MKVRLLKSRDGCDAGAVVDYGPDKARELIGLHEAEMFVPAPEPEPPKKKPTVVRYGGKNPATKEPAQAGSVVPEEE